MITDVDATGQGRGCGPQPDDDVAGERGAYCRIEHDASGRGQHRRCFVGQDAQHRF